MGNTYAKNQTELLVNTLVENTVTIGSQNGGTVSAMNIIQSDGCDFSGAKITQETATVINVDIFVKNVQSQTADLVYNEFVRQQAKSIGQNLNLNPGSIKSENLYRSINNFTNSVRTNIGTIVNSEAYSINLVECKGGGSFKDAVITQKSTTALITQGIIDNDTTQASKMVIEKTIEQTAVAEQKDAISAALWALGFAILCAAIFVFALTYLIGAVETGVLAVLLQLIVILMPLIILVLLCVFVWPFPGYIGKSHGWSPYKVKVDKQGTEIVTDCCEHSPEVNNNWNDKINYWCKYGCLSSEQEKDCCPYTTNTLEKCKTYINQTKEACNTWGNDVIQTCKCKEKTEKQLKDGAVDYSKEIVIPPPEGSPGYTPCIGGCILTDPSDIPSPNIVGPICMSVLYLLIIGFYMYMIYKRITKK